MLISSFVLASGLLPGLPAQLLQALKGTELSASWDHIGIHAQDTARSLGAPSLPSSMSSG